MQALEKSDTTPSRSLTLRDNSLALRQLLSQGVMLEERQQADQLPQGWKSPIKTTPARISSATTCRLSGVGVGTSRSMHTGHATSEWLQGVVSNEVNDLAAAVDNHARQRELKISTAERAQLNLQISNLNKKVAGLEERLRRTEAMLPDEQGEYKGLKQELIELEADCDYYAGLSDREGFARKGAHTAIKSAIDHVDAIDQELLRFKDLIASIPESEQLNPYNQAPNLRTNNMQQSNSDTNFSPSSRQQRQNLAARAAPVGCMGWLCCR